MLSEGRPGLDNLYYLKDGTRASVYKSKILKVSALFMLSSVSQVYCV